MFKHLKQLAGDSLIYGVSGVIGKMIGIFLVPIYTRLFLPEDYGIINLINISFFLLSILIVSALDNSFARWFYDTKEESEQKKSFAVYVWYQFIVALFLSMVIILVSPYIARASFNEAGKPIYIILPALSLITNILPVALINWYRVQRKAVATVFFTIVQTITTIGFTILFVIIFRWGITGVFAALTISSAIFTIVAIFQLKGWLHISFFSIIRLREMLKFALPMIPAALSYWLLNNTDSYFILYFTKSTSEVGLFGIGAMMASMLSLFTGAFQQAWGPFAFSIIDSSDAKKVYANVFLLYGYIMGLLAALLLLFAPEGLMIFTTTQYYDSAWVAGILGYNLMLIGLSYIAIIGISIRKTTTPYGVAMLYATIITIVLNFILIPRFGKEGSAMATVIAQVIVPVYLFYIGQKVYSIPYKFLEVAILIVAFLGITIMIRFIQFDNLFIQILTKTIVAIFMIAAVFLLKRKIFIQLLLKTKQGKFRTKI